MRACRPPGLRRYGAPQRRGRQGRLASLISVLNVGFEQGGAVSRQEKRAERFVEVLYEVYASRIIAGIAGLKDTLEDRSLALVMFRRRKDEPVARLGREMEREAEALRDACALACLTRIADILTAYDLAPAILDGHEVDDRALDLWTPLLAIAMVADAEAGANDRAERIIRSARELSDAREADAEAGQAVRLVAALQRVAGEIGRMVTPTDLLQALHERGLAWLKSPRGLAGLLAPLGLVPRHAREGSRRGRFYMLDPGGLADLASQYDPAASEGPLAHDPEHPATSVDSDPHGS